MPPGPGPALAPADRRFPTTIPRAADAWSARLAVPDTIRMLPRSIVRCRIVSMARALRFERHVSALMRSRRGRWFPRGRPRAVHEGQIWIDNDCLKALLHKAGTISRDGRIDNVSTREQQILDQIALGRKNKEIAAQLFMSEQTVKAHLSRIFKKFNVSSRTELLSHLNRIH